MIPNTLITSMIRKKDAAKYKAMDGNSVDNGSKSHKTKGKKRKKKKNTCIQVIQFPLIKFEITF